MPFKISGFGLGLSMSALSFRHLCRLAFPVLLLFGAGSVPAFAACQTTTQVVPPGGSFTNTGCISTTDINAVSAGPGSTVNNAAGGTISLTTSVLTTAGINATGNSNIITNAGDMTVTSTNLSGSAIFAPGLSNTI